jgi:hypothetical protein
VESAALGLGYATTLVWIGSAFVGSFSGYEAVPYWSAVPRLRTDTAGVLAFAVAAVCLTVAKYLQLARRGDAPVRRDTRPAGVLALQSVGETAAVLGTALVIYLSLNEVTHPWTLTIQLTHLLPWPTEGTVRVLALAICLLSVAVRRYLRATAGQAALAEPGPRDDTTAEDLHRADWPAGYAGRRYDR